MEKVLALYDSDFYYTTRFMEYFNNKKEFGIRIAAFTRKESLEDYLRSHSVELLVIGSDLSVDELSYQNVKYKYALSEFPGKKEEVDFLQIDKYQTASAVMNQILADYHGREALRSAPNSSKQMKIISVLCPVSGVEKLSFVWSLGSILSEQEKVLFVSLDPLPIPLGSQPNHTQNLTEFIYYLKENDDITKLMPLVLQSERLFYLTGILHGLDILSLTKEDMIRWTDVLSKYMDFRTVIFYIGCYNEAIMELLRQSDSILTVSIDSSYEATVQTELERQLKLSGIPMDKLEPILLDRWEGREELPLTLQELMNSPFWMKAKQYLST